MQRLRLPSWDQLSNQERDDLVHLVAARLPKDFVSAGMAAYAMGDQEHVIALFQRKGETFALVPGGRMTLGWSGAAFALTEVQRRIWLEGTRGIDDRPPERQLATMLTPRRQVDIEPFLVAVAARDAWHLLEALKERGGLPEDGSEVLQAIDDLLREEGLRLPTDDEWEHCVRGGSVTLFRWGDTWPDGIPHRDRTAFERHRTPNAFGLTIAEDPYFSECVKTPIGFRGGDGGSDIHGALPAPRPWGALASSFRLPWDDVAGIVHETLEMGLVRPVLDIAR